MTKVQIPSKYHLSIQSNILWFGENPGSKKTDAEYFLWLHWTQDFLYLPTNTFKGIGCGAGYQYQLLIILSCRILFALMAVIRSKCVFFPFQRRHLGRNHQSFQEHVKKRENGQCIGAIQLSTRFLGQSSEIPLQLKTASRDTWLMVYLSDAFLGHCWGSVGRIFLQFCSRKKIFWDHKGKC